MSSFEKYRLMDILWVTVIDYCTKDPISKPLKAVLQRLKDEGYTAQVLNNDRDFRVVQVQDQRYRIVRNRAWTKCDLIMVD